MNSILDRGLLKLDGRHVHHSDVVKGNRRQCPRRALDQAKLAGANKPLNHPALTHSRDTVPNIDGGKQERINLDGRHCSGIQLLSAHKILG